MSSNAKEQRGTMPLDTVPLDSGPLETVLSDTLLSNTVRVSTWLWDAGFALSCATLGWGLLRPLERELPWHSWPQMILYLCAALLLIKGLVHALLSAHIDHRAYSLCFVSALLYLVAHLDAWALSSAGRMSSALSAALSVSVVGLPWIALATAFSFVSLGALQFASLLRLTATLGHPAGRILSLLGSSFTTLLWLRALLSYASGSPALFPN